MDSSTASQLSSRPLNPRSDLRDRVSQHIAHYPAGILGFCPPRSRRCIDPSYTPRPLSYATPIYPLPRTHFLVLSVPVSLAGTLVLTPVRTSPCLHPGSPRSLFSKGESIIRSESTFVRGRLSSASPTTLYFGISAPSRASFVPFFELSAPSYASHLALRPLSIFYAAPIACASSFPR